MTGGAHNLPNLQQRWTLRARTVQVHIWIRSFRWAQQNLHQGKYFLFAFLFLYTINTHNTSHTHIHHTHTHILHILLITHTHITHTSHLQALVSPMPPPAVRTCAHQTHLFASSPTPLWCVSAWLDSTARAARMSAHPTTFSSPWICMIWRIPLHPSYHWNPLTSISRCWPTTWLRIRPFLRTLPFIPKSTIQVQRG